MSSNSSVWLDEVSSVGDELPGTPEFSVSSASLADSFPDPEGGEPSARRVFYDPAGGGSRGPSPPRPDHLVDTRIFHEVATSSLIHAEPFPVTIVGFRLGQANTATLRVFNKSATLQRFHVIPPADAAFSIDYTKVRYFVPGSTLKIRITFTPREQRLHTDRILLHCEDEWNLAVPVLAFPSVTFAAFPRHIRLPDTPVGRRLTHRIPLLVQAAVETRFRVTVDEPSAEMSVAPTEGVLPAEDEAPLHLTLAYCPRQFSTARTTLRLHLSDCGLQPAVCTVAARCVPGLRRDRLAAESRPTVVPRTGPVLPPPGEVGPHHQLRLLAAADGAGAAGELDLTTHGGVVKFLLRKFTASVTVQQTFQERPESALAAAGRERERAFNRARLRRAAQLAEKTDVRHGQPSVSEQERAAILAERERLWREYEEHVHPPATPAELGPPGVQYLDKRLLRSGDEPPRWRPPSFDVYLNRPWPSRLAALERFVRAARTVVLRCRADRRLKHLRRLVAAIREERQAQRDREEAERTAEAEIEAEGASEREEERLYEEILEEARRYCEELRLEEEEEEEETEEEVEEEEVATP